MHNPNPFDFIPFADHPFLRTPDEFGALGEHLSGYLEVKLKALTPVHIVSYQKRGSREGESFMYREDDKPCIPAASIRGCLRSIIEALTSGWVSQSNQEYPKEFRKRHVGFKTFESYSNQGRRMRRKSPPAVDPAFEPQIRKDKKIDVASYLFGMVIEPESKTDTEHESLARKSKVWIEDALIDRRKIVPHKYWVPDITGEAFMGGAKPSASNWWYLQPAEIWERNTRGHRIAEFIGNEFWGRKFYYHQDPLKCIKYYDKTEKIWNYSPERDFYRVWLEAMDPNSLTDVFRIYLYKVPRALVVLLLMVLIPGKNIRHKIGYGKAYGYGSIEFTFASARLRIEDSRGNIPATLEDYGTKILTWGIGEWNKEQLAKNKLEETIIDWQALESLARVMGWQDHEKLIFTYPPFAKGSFAQPIPFDRLEGQVKSLPKINPAAYQVTPVQARNIAAQLFNSKKPIRFRLYQEKAEGWDLIARRKP